MRARLLGMLSIAVLACLTYANAVDGSFHFDDSHAVVDNPSIRSLANLGRFFTDPGTFSVLPQNQGYRPLLLVTYALTARVTGVEPRAFIAVNLAIHILCALLIYAVVALTLRQLGRPDNAGAVGLAAGLIFAVHPLFSECVSYVSARSESLSAAFTLASLYCYLRARESRASLFVPLSMLAIAGALLTKPVATIFPLILIVFEAAAAERQPPRQIAARFVPVTGVVLVLGILSGRMTPPLAIRAASNFTHLEYLRSELPAIWHYLRLFVAPYGQSADLDYPLAASFLQPNVVAAGLGLAALITFSIWGIARRRYTGAALVVAWFILCIFPSSSLFPLAEIVNEHRPYLAAASLCALTAWLLVQALPLAEKWRTVALVLVLAPLCAATVARNRSWHSEQTLWRDVVDKSPGSTRAQMNLGLALMSSGHMAEAEPHLREAVRLGPYYAYAHINLGSLFLAQGKNTEALDHLQRAIQLNPELFWAHYYRGLAAEKLNESPVERIALFSTTTRLSPNYADAWYHLALAYEAAGDLPHSLQATRQAVALRGSWDDRFMLAFVLLKLGDARGAQPLLQKLHAERPGDPRINQDLDVAAKLLAGKP